MNVEQVSNAATQGGAGVAVVSGAVKGIELVFGLTPNEWSVVGVLGGLAIWVAGLVVNVYFQWKRSRHEVGR
jgi:F0F1-type ATP synthase assembly protein I